MNDLVSRLRAAPSGLDEAEELALLREAADEIERLAAMQAPRPTIFWDYEDPECGYSDPGEILDRYSDGEIIRIDAGAVLETTFAARLPAADDAGRDDPWEVEADTLEEAEALVTAELVRRQAPTPETAGA